MISVVIPVYNEKDGILDTLQDVKNALADFTEHEIILVDDGSTDGTSELLRRLSGNNIFVLNHVENQGYGKSLFDGIIVAKHECVAIIDGDTSYPAKYIKELYKYYPVYDMVVGARTGREYLKGFIKNPARKIFQLLTEYTVGKKIPDVNSGLRIFKKSIVMSFADSLCAGFSFTTTITLLFMLNHYYVKYVPIEYLGRKGKSKVGHVIDSLRAAQIIVQAILHHNPIKLFLLLSLVNVLGGPAIGILNELFWKMDFLSIVAALLFSSVVPVFCLGLIAEQIRKKGSEARGEQNRIFRH